jgi:hypothetical protein
MPKRKLGAKKVLQGEETNANRLQDFFSISLRKVGYMLMWLMALNGRDQIGSLYIKQW